MENILHKIAIMDLNTTYFCTLALHYTDIMKNSDKHIGRSLHAGIMELYYYRQATVRLMAEWMESKQYGTPLNFKFQFEKFIQPMLNRITELSAFRLNRTIVDLPVIKDSLFDLSYEISLIATSYQSIRFPGIQTLQS